MNTVTVNKVKTLAIGAKLTVKPDKLDCFRSEWKRKIAGRTAVVTGHTYPSCNPMVVFPAIGRKREVGFGGYYTLASLRLYFDIEGDVIEMEVVK